MRRQYRQRRSSHSLWQIQKHFPNPKQSYREEIYNLKWEEKETEEQLDIRLTKCTNEMWLITRPDGHQESLNDIQCHKISWYQMLDETNPLPSYTRPYWTRENFIRNFWHTITNPKNPTTLRNQHHSCCQNQNKQKQITKRQMPMTSWIWNYHYQWDYDLHRYQTKRTCDRCNLVHQVWGWCPAYGSICFKCQWMNHCAVCSHSRTPPQAD